MQLALGAIAAALVGTAIAPAHAQDEFDSNGIRFDVDTAVEFEFIESHNAYQSTFGVINLDTGERTPLLVEVKPSDTPESPLNPSDYTSDVGRPQDFLGTPGNTVPTPIAEYIFRANTRYAFYLESTFNGQPAGIVYSTNVQNQGNNTLVRFQGGTEGLANKGTTLSWDDTGSIIVRTNQADRDFDDFVVQAGGYTGCRYSTVSQAAPNQQSMRSSNPIASAAQGCPPK